jgi:FKBP-type peptidyl-prolyl cis-trans isomerase
VKLRNLLVAGVAMLAACGTHDTVTNPNDIGPPPALPAGTDTVTTASGLKYADIALGTGPAAVDSSVVAVHYTGWLSNGTAFDTSEGGLPLQLKVGHHDVIPGFEEGVRGMQVGGKRRLIIPPDLAYGNTSITDGTTGKVVIPANSTLIFDVRLVAIQ